MSVPRQLIPSTVIATALVAITPFIITSNTLLDIARVSGIYAIVAISLGISWGQAGMLSTCQAGFASVGAYATAIATTRYGLPVFLGLILAITVPAALAFLVASMVARLSSLSLVLATLVFGTIIEYAISSGGDFTGGFIGISGIPEIPFLSSPLYVHIAVWVTVCLLVLLYALLDNSTQGRALRMISKDRYLAKSLGIHISRRLSVTFSFCGAIAGLGGWFYAHTSMYMSPQSLPELMSLTVLIMVMVGGKGAVLGPVLGAVVVSILLNVIPGAALQGLIYGSTLVAVILCFPDGLLDDQWTSRFRRFRHILIKAFSDAHKTSAGKTEEAHKKVGH